MADFTDHDAITTLLKKAQELESERRDKVREVLFFLREPDGQWEDIVTTSFKDRPRYTFDKCNDIVDDIAGEMEQADFSIKVKPAGGDATKDLAKTYDGLIRNIENLSNAVDIFNASGRTMISAGFDGWRVSQRWGDNNSFDQDLYIDGISDFVDRVWFDFNSVLQTREDSEWCFVLQSMSLDRYKEMFPDGSGRSVGQPSAVPRDRHPEVVVVGEILYIKKVTRRIVEMNNGAVFVDDDKFKKVKDELEKQGVVETRSREREANTVKTRIFDGSDWLTDIQDTVFEFIPVIPTYGNWSVSQSIPNYWGIITKKMDAQRVFNYSRSRQVEETALAPLEKIMATPTQVGGNKETWQKLNTSSDPVLLYDVDPDAPSPPFKIGGPRLNEGLEVTAASATENLQSTAGIDQLNGQPVGLQSGVAVELKQNKGDTRNFKYFQSQEIAICHTAKIIIRAAPKVYDTKRLVRIINEDGSFDMVMLNEEVIDEQSKEKVTLNDLSRGLYDVVCDVGPAFKNRQQETVQAFREMAEIDPSIIQEGKDIWYANLNAPGMDALAERTRQTMLLSGQIPETQMTDEEKEFLADQEDPPPDPVALALEREADNADDKVQLDGIEEVRKEKELDAKIESDRREQDRKDAETQAKINNESMKTGIAQMMATTEDLNKHADTFKKLGEAMETIIGPGGMQAFIDQAAIVRESQSEQL